MEVTNTYEIKGKLKKVSEVEGAQDWEELDEGASLYRQVDETIEAVSESAAIDHFEKKGWEFQSVSIRLVTEAEKMRMMGHPTLFDI